MIARKSIAVLLAWPPTRDNLGWPTALPWYLLSNAPAEVDIHLFYFRHEEKHRDRWMCDLKSLRLASVTELEPYWTKWENWLRLRSPASRQGFPVQVDWFPVRRKTLRRIQACKPDAIWIYPHWLSSWAAELEAEGIVVTGPDCAVLHHERALSTLISRNPEEIEKQKSDLATYLVLERYLATTRAAVHVVGQADADRFNELAQRPQAMFTVHPHFGYVARAEGKRGGEPLRVIMSGDPSAVYIGDHGQRIVDSLVKESSKLRDEIAVTLTGKNWDTLSAKLLGAGYSVRQETWVEDYPATLAAHDVALCPYAVGVGTKGKVLQAMATGLLTIGSRMAFENVQAMVGRDFLEYKEPEEISHLLAGIIEDRAEGERIAEAGANAVREYHSPHKTGEAFWSYALSANGQFDAYREASSPEGVR